MVGSDTFNIKNSRLLCIVDDYSKFLVVKTTCGLSADSPIRVAKIEFAESGLPKKIVSAVDTNFISYTFRQFAGTRV